MDPLPTPELAAQTHQSNHHWGLEVILSVVRETGRYGPASASISRSLGSNTQSNSVSTTSQLFFAFHIVKKDRLTSTALGLI